METTLSYSDSMLEILKVVSGLLLASAALAAPATTANSSASTTSNSNPLIVKTKAGTIQGHYSLPNVREFLGIPFGKANRWEKAVAVTNYSTSPLQASSYGSSCYQDFASTQGALFLSTYALVPTPQSEDCLSINVWTPSASSSKSNANKGGLPVALWTYGGAYVLGTTNTPEYNGSYFARDGVIMVSYNYRESIFGFPNAPQINKQNTNLGLYDGYLALQWVQDNIAAFGGDPNRVTVFGQSAGSSTTSSFLEHEYSGKVPLSAAILLSGATQTLRNPYGSFTSWNKLASLVGCTQPSGSAAQFTCMKGISADVLNTMLGVKNLFFAPVDDDITRSSAPQKLIATKKVPNVPVMAGTTQDDGTLFSTGQLTFDDWIQNGGVTGQLYGFNPTLKGKLDINKAHAAYPQYQTNTLDAIQAAFRDYVFLCPEQKEMKARKAAFPNTPIWRYSFGAINPGEEHGVLTLKAFHASDIPFAFNTFTSNPEVAALSTPDNYALEAFWHKAFVQFITNPHAGPGWADYSPQKNNLAYVGYADKNPRGLVVSQNTFDANCDNFLAGGYS